MEHAIVHPAAIFAVDDFAHEPEIRLHGSGLGAHLLHEAEIHDVGTV